MNRDMRFGNDNNAGNSAVAEFVEPACHNLKTRLFYGTQNTIPYNGFIGKILLFSPAIIEICQNMQTFFQLVKSFEKNFSSIERKNF